MCASDSIVGFSPCFMGTRSRASPSPRANLHVVFAHCVFVVTKRCFHQYMFTAPEGKSTRFRPSPEKSPYRTGGKINEQKYEMWPLFHLGAIWQNLIFFDHLFPIRFRVFTFSPPGRENIHKTGEKKRIFKNGKNQDARSVIFWGSFVFWHDFMTDCWKTRAFPSVQ